MPEKKQTFAAFSRGLLSQRYEIEKRFESPMSAKRHLLSRYLSASLTERMWQVGSSAASKAALRLYTFQIMVARDFPELGLD